MKRLLAYPFYAYNEIKIFYRVFFLSLIFFFYILLFVPANAETYKLQCIYEEDGKKIITIDEKNKKIRNLPVVWGPQWNYRKSGEYTYIYEVADFRKQMIIRFTIDLENLLEETIYLKVTKRKVLKWPSGETYCFESLLLNYIFLTHPIRKFGCIHCCD